MSMKTLENCTNKELLIQLMKNIGKSIWNSKMMTPFRNKWETSQNFRELMIILLVLSILLIISIGILLPILTWFTNLVNYVYWGIDTRI